MTRPIRIGLTGSIGMGKSTVAGMFRDLGLPVWDADDAVRRLYDIGGAAVAPIEALNADTVTGGRVHRTALKRWIEADDSALEKIEKVVHPLVAEDRRRFVSETDSDIVVLDVPLLLETGSEDDVDVLVVVSAPEAIQRERVLSRGTMTEGEFRSILSRQVPDATKRRRADWVVPTVSMDETRMHVARIVRKLRSRYARNRS